MIKLNLERTGNYEVRTENIGGNAIAAVREFQPDLLFLDVMMPGTDGTEIADQLKNEEEFANLKFIFMTAIISKEETDKLGSNIGGNEYLAKPVKTEELIETIERVFGG
jgi:CheY-like chemotaxis protein